MRRTPSCGNTASTSRRSGSESNNWMTATAVLNSRQTAARYLGIGTTMLDKLIGTRDLPTVRIGRRVMIHGDDLNEYLEGLEGPEGPGS